MKLYRKNLSNARQWIFKLLEWGSTLSAMMVDVTCWHIWEARHVKRNDEGDPPHPLQAAVKRSKLMWT
jgi:hypothetical protein